MTAISSERLPVVRLSKRARDSAWRALAVSSDSFFYRLGELFFYASEDLPKGDPNLASSGLPVLVREPATTHEFDPMPSPRPSSCGTASSASWTTA